MTGLDALKVKYIGQNGNAVAQELKNMGYTVRFICPFQIITADYNPERIGLTVDNSSDSIILDIELG